MKVGIAGAGIAGQLLALALHNLGWQVSIFDQGHEKNCSMAAAGLLVPMTELVKSDLTIFQIGMDSIKTYWPAILKQLPEKIDFQQTGSLLVAHPKDQTELTHYIRLISAKQNNKTNCKKLDQEEIKALEPALEKFHDGYYLQDEGFIDNQKLLSVLAQYLKEKIFWHQDQFVSHLEPGKIFIREDVHHFDQVFDCRGLGAKSIFNDLRGMRGEIIWLHAPDVHITRPVQILHPRYGIYIVPRANQTYIIGATEIESEQQENISVRGVLELLTAVFYVHAGFSEARIIKTVTQCRPVLSNHLPSIKYTDGFAAINGLYRHGFLLAPALIADIASWAQEGISSVRYPYIWETCT